MLSNDHVTPTFTVTAYIPGLASPLCMHYKNDCFFSYLYVYISVFSILFSFCDCFQTSLCAFRPPLPLSPRPHLHFHFLCNFQEHIFRLSLLAEGVCCCHCQNSDRFILISSICRRGRLCLSPDSHQGNVQCVCALVACLK